MTVQIPPDHLNKTKIFHITAIDNLESILKSSFIYSTNHLKCQHHSIASEDVQGKRAAKQVAIYPFGVLHDYVPFYFAPRSPMLCSNYKENIPNACPQEEIVHLVTSAQIVAEAKLPFVFYDRHAIKAVAQPYNDLKSLDKIDWELFFELPILGGYSKIWNDRYDPKKPKHINRMEVRMAEFLVYQQLEWKFIKVIATMTKEKAEQVEKIMQSHGQQTRVIVKPEWYY